MNDKVAAGFCDVILLVADALAAFLKTLRGVDEQHVIAMLRRLRLAEEPYVGGNTGVVERIAGQLHDGVEPVVLQHVAADAVLAATGLTLVERARVLNNRHHAIVFELRQAVENEEHLPVALGRELLWEASATGGLEFFLHRDCLRIPRITERRVGDAVVELKAIELVSGEGISEAHVGVVLAADERARFAMPKVKGLNSWP